MVSAARRQIIGGGAPINKSRRRRPQIVGGGGAARPTYSSSCSVTRDVISAFLRVENSQNGKFPRKNLDFVDFPEKFLNFPSKISDIPF